MEKKKETVTFEFALGIKARDRVTKQEGILDMRAEYLNGCIRYSLQPQITEGQNEKRPESYWVDEQQLETVDEGINARPVEKSTTGGPVESSSNAKF